jgi:hypothetical protein
VRRAFGARRLGGMPRNVPAAVGSPLRAEDAPLGDVPSLLTATIDLAERREEGPVEVGAGGGENRLVDDGQGTKTRVSGPEFSTARLHRRGPLGGASASSLRGASAPQECIDVRSLGRYRVRPTEDRGKGCRIDPWHLEMLCKKGTIYPHGGTLLQAYSARPRTRRLLKALPCVRVHQDGDLETTVVFDVRDFVAVATVMKPRKRRPAPAWRQRKPISRWP